MPNGWGGMLAAMCVVAAAFQGVELVGITAGEAQNPKHTLKRAVNNIVWRILVFYIGSIFVILCIYPWNEVSYIGSPFVMTFAKSVFRRQRPSSTSSSSRQPFPAATAACTARPA